MSEPGGESSAPLPPAAGEPHLPDLAALRPPVPDAPAYHLRATEYRLTTATDPRDVVLWTQVRGELLQQDQGAKEAERRRASANFQEKCHVAFAAGTVVLGAALAVAGFTAAGFFILGAGLFWIAPDYVTTYVKTFGRGKEDDDDGEQ